MSRLASLLAPPSPAIGVDVSGQRVTAVRLASSGRPALVTGFAVEALPEGAVVPALNHQNIADPAAVAGAIRRAVDRLGGRARHAALVVPDSIGKVSLLRFEKVPARAADLAELVRWQVRKSAPFRIDEAEVSFVPGARGEQGQEFVVTVARRDVVREYEDACEAAGLHAGVVDLATFNLVNAALAADDTPDGDWLLVHVAPDYLTVVILRGGDLIFYRHRGAEDEGSLADIVHQTAMYYEDRLAGAGFTRAVLAGIGRMPGATGDAGGLEPDQVRRQLEQRLETRVETIDPRPAVALVDRIAASPALLDTLAPAVGLLLRDRTA